MDFANASCTEFVTVLASNAPVPGGGGASALVAAIGTALGNMVGSLTVGKKKYADVEEDVKALMAKAEDIRARLLALVDADAEIVKRVGDIPAYFQSHGEAAFRRVEAEVLAELGKQSGLVIATGGGCVTREENYNSLHQNGTIVWLKRDLDKLPVSGRPVSQRDGVQAIYEKRSPLYQRFADIVVDNNGEPGETVSQILRELS